MVLLRYCTRFTSSVTTISVRNSFSQTCHLLFLSARGITHPVSPRLAIYSKNRIFVIFVRNSAFWGDLEICLLHTDFSPKNGAFLGPQFLTFFAFLEKSQNSRFLAFFAVLLFFGFFYFLQNGQMDLWEGFGRLVRLLSYIFLNLAS